MGRAGWNGSAARTATSQNDTGIAASCIRHNVPLVTLNTADVDDFVINDGLVMLSADG